MRKNLFLAVILTLLITSGIFAQDKTTDFLGGWKIDETQNKWFDKSRVESIIMMVSQKDGDLIVETETKTFGQKNNFLTRTEIYKSEGGTKVTLVGGINGGTQLNELKFLKNNRLELFSELTGENLISSIKQTWLLSENGQTLTIKRAARIMQKNLGDNLPAYTTIKWVFTKFEI